MNKKQMRKHKLEDYKAIIFDLDGTLYFQKEFKKKMFLHLMKYLFFHPTSLCDLKIVWTYRKVREKWDEYAGFYASDSDMEKNQYEKVAQLEKKTAKEVERAVQLFMHTMPLDLLMEFRDEKLQQEITRLQQQEISVYVYSDYPVTEKLKALQIAVTDSFAATDQAINCLKPDPKGLAYILEQIHCKAEDVIMIGDRYEKDGLAAIGNQMDYIILDANRHKRYEFLEKEICS